MSDERLDCEISDVSISDATSWADAQADTPTLGKSRSDSEDTLSNLSFDNELVADGNNGAGTGLVVGLDKSNTLSSSASAEDILPLPELKGLSTKVGQKATGAISSAGAGVSNNTSSSNSNNALQAKFVSYKSDDDDTSSSGFHVELCVTTADVTNVGTNANGGAGGPSELHLNLPPGVSYQAPSVDFPPSPSQLKVSQGDSFMPKEDAGTVSEDDTSFASSCRAHLDLNLQNGGVRLTKKVEELVNIASVEPKPSSLPLQSTPSKMASIPSFEISSYCDDDDSFPNRNHNSSVQSLGPESFVPIDGNEELDDYMEDFYLPISNESVMSRQTSFRRKVQKQLETAAAETAINELNKFDRMLSSYEEETENELNAEEADEESFQAHPKSSTPKEKSTIVLYDPEVSLRLEENSRKITFGRGKDQVKDVRRLNKVRQVLNFDDFVDEPTSGQGISPVITLGEDPESILDIDAICQTHAPNLMSVGRRDSDDRSSTSEIVEYEKPTKTNVPSSVAAEGEPQSLLMTAMATNGEYELESGYFLQKCTLDKLTSVYDLTNFTNLYTLSGELKHILTPVEIEELVTNRIHLENIIDPKVMAALSWSLNETSFPLVNHVNNNCDDNSATATETIHQNSDEDSCKASSTATTVSSSSSSPHPQLPVNTVDESNGKCTTGSKNSSISAGFHSQSPSVESLNSDDHSDIEHEKPPDSNSTFTRGAPQTSSLRRKISVEDSSITSDLPQKYVEIDLDDAPITNPIIKKLVGSHNHSVSSTCSGNSSYASANDTLWRSLENLGNLQVEDYEIESGNESDNGIPKIFLVRRDSKRFNKRSVQGLFVESKNGSSGGTLRRIKAPLHLSEDYTVGTEELAAGTAGDNEDLSLEAQNINNSSTSAIKVESQVEKKAKRLNTSNKKRIAVDEKILSVASDLDDTSQATDVTQSDVFHSFMSSLKDDDPTIKSDMPSDDDDVDEITLDLDSTPDDDMEGSILGNIEDIQRITPPQQLENNGRGHTVEDEIFEDIKWRSFRVGANDIQIDMKAIEPYRRVLSHGGYYDAEKNIAIILFSGCYLPDRSRKEYSHLMDHLFLYVLSGLEELINQDYILVYLHGATPRSCQPSFGWLKRCYQLIDRKLRKNLKALHLVHPTFWLRTVVALTRPFISSKFSQKIQFVNTLAELCLEIPTEHLVIPDKVLQYDFDLKIAELKKQDQLS